MLWFFIGFIALETGSRYEDLAALTGGASAITGGAGADHLDGGAGDDTLIGGTGGDTYNIGLNQGADTIDDQGDGVGDTIVFYGGGVVTNAGEFHFALDGADMVVTAKDSSGTVVSQFRIDNMGTTAGQIERLNLLDGAETATLVSIDLTQEWATLVKAAQPAPPTWSITPNTTSVYESDGSVTFTVTRSDASTEQTVYISTTAMFHFRYPHARAMIRGTGNSIPAGYGASGICSKNAQQTSLN